MDVTNLVIGERVRKVFQYSDTNDNARMVENPSISVSNDTLVAEIVEVRTWTSTDGSVGTELEFTLTPTAESNDTALLNADPLPGEPVGNLQFEFQVTTSSAASAGRVASSVVEAV